MVSVLLMLPRMPDVARVPSQSVLSEEIAEDKEAGKNDRQGRINSKLDRRNRRVLQEMQWTDERKSPNLEGSWNVKNSAISGPKSAVFMSQNIIEIWQCVKTLVPLVNIKIAGKWMFIPLKMDTNRY